MNAIIRSIGISCSILWLVGCSETTLPPEDVKVVTDSSYTSRVFNIDFRPYDRNFMAYSSVREVVINANGEDYKGTLPRSQFTTAWNPGFGSVEFRDSALDLLGSDTYSYDGDLSNLLVNGEVQSFKVYDCLNFPTDTLTASVVGPTGYVEITSPHNGDTLDKQNHLTIRWTSSASDQEVAIAFFAETDAEHPGLPLFITKDDGAFTISSDDLSKLSSGLCDINIKRGNVNTGTGPDRSKWVAWLFTQYSITVRLK